MPEPATRSRTVEDTSTSPACATAATREPVCTAIPASLSPMRSTSPVLQTAPHGDPEGGECIPHGNGAPDAARRAVERRKEAIAGGVDLAAAVAGEDVADGRVVALQQRAPLAVAELLCSFRRADDIGEEHGRQDLLGLRRLPEAGEKLARLRNHLICDVEPGDVIPPLELDESSTRNLLGQPAPLPERHDGIGRCVQNERGHVDRRSDVADIDFAAEPHERNRCCG